MARFLLEMKEEENEPVQPPVRVSVKPRSLSPSSPLSSSPSPPSSPIQFAASPRVIKPTPAPPVASNTERKSVLQTARVFQKPKSDPFWNYSEKPKPKSKFSFKKPVNGKFFFFKNFGFSTNRQTKIFRSDGNVEPNNRIVYDDEMLILSEYRWRIMLQNRKSRWKIQIRSKNQSQVS